MPTIWLCGGFGWLQVALRGLSLLFLLSAFHFLLLPECGLGWLARRRLMARLYPNENFPLPVIEKLQALGHDVLTVQEPGAGLTSAGKQQGCFRLRRPRIQRGRAGASCHA